MQLQEGTVLEDLTRPAATLRREGLAASGAHARVGPRVPYGL
jgi:hypothetical protein